jgi:Bax protein
LAENERILADRRRLLELLHRRAQGDAPAPHERAWLDHLAQRYDTDADDAAELSRRVDAIPPSLAVAQAALETGWGTSRAAHRGRAMFGQMAFSGEGERATARVRAFDSLAQGVAAYALNLNAHRAYAEFRARRAELRWRGDAPDGFDLARFVIRYSERRQAYVRDLRGIIRANKLQSLDQLRLTG